MTVRSRRRARKVLLASTLCLWAERAGEGPAWPGLFLSLLPQHFEAIEWILLNAFQQCQFSNCRGTPRVTCATGRSRFRGGSLSAPRIVVRLARGGKAVWGNCKMESCREEFVGSRENEKAQVQLRGAFVGREVSWGAGDDASGRWVRRLVGSFGFANLRLGWRFGGGLASSRGREARERSFVVVVGIGRGSLVMFKPQGRKDGSGGRIRGAQLGMQGRKKVLRWRAASSRVEGARGGGNGRGRG